MIQTNSVNMGAFSGSLASTMPSYNGAVNASPTLETASSGAVFGREYSFHWL